MTPVPDMLADRYRILATLGQGGMGQVFRVEDTTRGQAMALKLLSAHAGMDDGAFLLFKQEFRTMAKLAHPHTCAVYDYGRLADGTPYFTMEEVPGHGLDELLPLEPAQVASVLQQLGSALGYIHQQGFVHCDLKPENIRLTPDGTVKLMDFGLMEVAGQTGGAIKGTLAYIAPEVAKQDRIDQRSDIYSLGAVTYELLTGAPPFSGETPLDYLKAHLSQVARPLREVRPEIPQPVEAVVARMLAKEPTARFQSMHDVLAALGIEMDAASGGSLLASAFIGRQAELERLMDGVHDTRPVTAGGSVQVGRALWLTGAPGAGKSRLLSEFRFAVQLEEIPYLSGTANEQRAPYGPFIAVLRAVLPLARQHCLQELAAHAAVLGKLLPELADGQPAPSLEPDQEKILTQAAFCQVILKATAHTGAVVVLDQWDLADALSRETLTYLLRNAAEAPLLVVVASRDEVAAGGTAVALRPMTERETTAVALSMLGTQALPEGLGAQLHDLTAGNPLFVANTLEHLLRSGSLHKQQGQWHFPPSLAPTDLPSDVKAIVLARLENLSAPALELAGFAAVAGRPFTVGLAAEVIGLDDDALFDALDTLKQARVLTASEGVYTLAETALRLALYEGTAPDVRERWHLGLAEALERRLVAAGDSDLALLTQVAEHYLKTSHRTKAINYAYEAASRNHTVFALEIARKLLEDGLAMGQQGLGENETLRCDYLNLLATTAHWQHDLETAQRALHEGVPLAERLGDQERLLEMLVTQAKNGALSGSSARIAQALTLFERAVGLAETLGNQKTAARARVNLGRCLFFQGQQARAREVFELAAARARAAELPNWYASSLSFWGYLQVLEGPATREQGFKHIAEALELQERIGDRGGLGYSYNLMFEVQIQAGRLGEALEAAERNGEISHELGIQDDYNIALLNQAIALTDMGRLQDAQSVGARCRALAERNHHKVALPIVNAVTALAAVYQGRAGEGAAQMRAAEQLARETSNHVYAIVIPYVIECWLALGNLQDALNAAQEAQFLLRSMDDQHAQVRLWIHLAEIHGRMGQSDVAREFLDRGIESAIAMNAQSTVVRGLRVKAWLSWKDDARDEATRTAEQALKLASLVGSDWLSAELLALLGDVAVGTEPATALAHYQALEALADRMGAAWPRVQALAGQAAALTDAEQGGLKLIEAQKVLRGVADSLPDDLQSMFLATSDVQRILERIPGVREGLPTSPEASMQTFERLQRVTHDLQSVAGQYGLLFKEWSVKSQQLEMLNNLATKINETLNVEAVLSQVVQMTLEITQAERGFLLLRDADNPELLVCQAAFNQFGRPIQHERCSSTVSAKVLATGQPLAIMDAMANEEFQATKSIMALNLRTLMCVPLVAKGETLGVLYVDSQAVVTTFTDKDLTLLQAIASHASVAIENAMLYTALNRRAAELERAVELYRKADYEASTDMLTGLRNRRFFQEQAARELDISQRYSRPLSVVMLDVDHFKSFNDTYGHAVGDEVLKAVAEVLTAEARDSDLPSRFGGEEFVVLCPDTDGPGAMLLAERIRAAIEAVRVNDGDGQPVRPLTASLGVSAMRPADRDIDTMIVRADEALYACKAAGRNQVQLCPDELATPHV